MPRRLGINLTFLNPDRTGGAETYVRSLLHQYHQLALSGLDLPIHLFVGRDHRLTVDPDRFKLIGCDIDPRNQYRRIIWEQTHLPSILNQYNLDLVHFPYSAYPIRYRGQSVISIHDTTRFVSPKGVPKAQIWYRQVMESRLPHNGHHVITVSRADAAILQQHLSLADAQLSVIHHGVSDIFRVTDPYDGPRDYLLWTGRPYDHKRLDTLLAAYSRLESSLPLRLVGIPPTDAERLRGQFPSQRISFEPPKPHDQLPDLYRKAAIFLFPSSYESFGLPALEAMASGTPVICSDIAAFKELYSPAAEFFPNRDAGALATAIANLLSDPGRQRALQLAGIRHASEFTWQSCAQQTLDLYRLLLT